MLTAQVQPMRQGAWIARENGRPKAHRAAENTRRGRSGDGSGGSRPTPRSRRIVASDRPAAEPLRTKEFRPTHTLALPAAWRRGDSDHFAVRQVGECRGIGGYAAYVDAPQAGQHSERP